MFSYVFSGIAKRQWLTLLKKLNEPRSLLRFKNLNLNSKISASFVSRTGTHGETRIWLIEQARKFWHFPIKLLEPMDNCSEQRGEQMDKNIEFSQVFRKA